jgi:hypothetical protein
LDRDAADAAVAGVFDALVGAGSGTAVAARAGVMAGVPVCRGVMYFGLFDGQTLLGGGEGSRAATMAWKRRRTTRRSLN